MIDGIVFDSEWCAEYIQTEWYFRKKHGLPQMPGLLCLRQHFGNGSYMTDGILG